MRQLQSPKLTRARSLSIALLCALALSCLQCATTTITCGGVADCRDPEHAPVCSHPDCTACHSTLRICMYRLKDAPGCPCLETDVKTCTLSGGGRGISSCRRTSGTTTAWGPCNPP